MGSKGHRDRGVVLIRRALPFVLAALLLAPRDTNSAAPQTCPKGAVWHGAAPPRGTGYACVKSGPDGSMTPGPDGRPILHGWAVLYDPITSNKKEECEYQDGLPHGHCTAYDKDGDRSQRGYFDHGKRVKEWWFWSFAASSDGANPGLTSLAKSDDPAKNVARREHLARLLSRFGASETDAAVLTQAVLEYVDDPAATRRVTCGETMCVGPGRIPGEPLYVKFGAASPDPALAELGERARIAQESEGAAFEVARKQAEVENKRLQAEYKVALAKYEKLSKRWDRTPLRCNDGARSPTCVCGGSWRGCCSWHGGVDGCPDAPVAPTPPPPLATP